MKLSILTVDTGTSLSAIIRDDDNDVEPIKITTLEIGFALEIAKRVNAHDELVAMLKTCSVVLREHFCGTDAPALQTAMQALTLLAKLEQTP